MIIDTNGFEIGDGVWYTSVINHKETPIRKKIRDMVIYDNKFIIYTEDIDLTTKNFYGLYHTEQECQLACDRLNGISHD